MSSSRPPAGPEQSIVVHLKLAERKSQVRSRDDGEAQELTRRLEDTGAALDNVVKLRDGIHGRRKAPIAPKIPLTQREKTRRRPPENTGRMGGVFVDPAEVIKSVRAGVIHEESVPAITHTKDTFEIAGQTRIGILANATQKNMDASDPLEVTANLLALMDTEEFRSENFRYEDLDDSNDVFFHPVAKLLIQLWEGSVWKHHVNDQSVIAVVALLRAGDLTKNKLLSVLEGFNRSTIPSVSRRKRG